MAYLLDTNILISAKNAMPLDLFPSFWDKLREHVLNGNVYSSVKVNDEINRGHGDEDLVRWINSLPTSFFLPFDTAIILQKYAQVIAWANQNPQFLPAAKHEFASASVADAFLIATACANKMKLVTNEISEPNRRNRVKIPDAARAFSVPCCSLIEMLRDLHTVI